VAPHRTSRRRPRLESDAREGGSYLEPAYRIAEVLGLPPFKLWFDWRFEDLDRIPERGPALLAANHISYLDPVAHAYFLAERGRRARFLAKSELFEIPVFGAALRNAKQIPVQRGARDRSPLERAERALADGEAVVVYPEGTVTNDPRYLPMRARTGVVRLSLASGVPITPLVVWGAQHVWQKSGRGSLRIGRPIWVKAGAPIDLSAYRGQADDGDVLRRLTDDLIERLRALVTDLRGRYPARWS
jgi:1-acyl-sn-glycerol-3-phosphate acyltransferase